MLFSEHFRIERNAVDDWFDPILDADTKLFVDPFLIFKETTDPWKEAHAKIVSHFD